VEIKCASHARKLKLGNDLRMYFRNQQLIQSARQSSLKECEAGEDVWTDKKPGEMKAEKIRGRREERAWPYLSRALAGVLALTVVVPENQVKRF
jgi:hypothetical protein